MRASESDAKDLCCVLARYERAKEEMRRQATEDAARSQRQTQRRAEPTERKVAQNRQPEGVRWQCATCTFINTGGSELCAMCHNFDAEVVAGMQATLAASATRQPRKPPVITRADIAGEMALKDLDATGEYNPEELVELFMELLDNRDMKRLLLERNIDTAEYIEKDQLVAKIRSLVRL